jgi:hypothetical protein
MLKLQPNEKIIASYRRHWLAFVFAIAPIVLLGLAVIFLPLFLNSFAPDIVDDFSTLVFLGAVLALEVLWIIGSLIIVDYYLDVWIVTNRRLVFIELHGAFSRIVSSVTLANIQDVSTEVHGILATILKYGEVKIQSAGTSGEFVFKQVPKPNNIKDLIISTRDKFLKRNMGSMDIQKPDGSENP